MTAAVGRRVLAAGACLLLPSCFSDPAPDPDVAPVEIIATPDGCGLNRDSVGAGTHDVTVIVEEGTGRVRILSDGQPIFEEAGATPGQGVTSAVELEAGEYVVECVVNGATSTTDLKVLAPSSGGGGY